MKQVVVPASPKQRVLAFLKAFREAPNDADIEIRTGRTEDGIPSILVSIGRDDHALLATEARTVADIMERTMNELSGLPEARELPNMIMGLRAGADAAGPESSGVRS
jgi:hypothetical protein